MTARRLLPLAVLLVVLPTLFRAPTLDEESYLWLGAHLDPTRPYSWTRSWPPYDGDGFVYAHPPLHLWWMWLLHGLPVALQRVVSSVVWGSLLGWGVGVLAERSTRRAALASALWLSSSVVLLGLQSALMVDLPAAALLTGGLALYRISLDSESRRDEVLAGLLLGLATMTKYPMAMALPIVALHAWRRGGSFLPVMVASGVFLADEGVLFLLHGREHLWEVWSRREEIPHGAAAPRALGVLARAALLPLPFLLFRTDPLTSLFGVAFAVLALVTVQPPGLSPAEGTVMLLFCIGGGLLLARAARTLPLRPGRRRKGDQDDGFLLGGVLLVWLVGVALTHNYASARYLLPAAAPAAILLARSAEEVRGGKALAWASAAASGVLAVAVAVADYRYARAGWTVGEEAAQVGVGQFAGEWSFRAAMEGAGWVRLGPDTPAPQVGEWVVVVDNASPGAVDTTGWEPVRRIESDDQFPLRVNDPGRNVSLYAETLGTLPLGWSEGRLEGATLYKVSR